MDLPTTILINNSLAVIANINNVELGSILYVFVEEGEPHKYEVIKRGKASFRVAELINDERIEIDKTFRFSYDSPQYAKINGFHCYVMRKVKSVTYSNK